MMIYVIGVDPPGDQERARAGSGGGGGGESTREDRATPEELKARKEDGELERR